MLHRLSQLLKVSGWNGFIRTLLMLVTAVGIAIAEFVLFREMYCAIITIVLTLLGWCFRKSIMKLGRNYSLHSRRFLFVYGLCLVVANHSGLGVNIQLAIIALACTVMFNLNFWSRSKSIKSSSNLESRRGSLIVFYLLAFSFTWAYWVPRALISRGFAAPFAPDSLSLLAGYGPALAATLTTFAFFGKPGLKHLFRRLVCWRVGLQWYVIALLLPAAIALTALALHLLLGRETGLAQTGGSILGASDTPLWERTLLLALMFTLGFDGLGEELGWRGFALPRLLKSYSALSASLILGVLWAAWHLPYSLTRGTAMSDAPFHSFLPGMFAAAILYTWIFNNTQGSVLLAILFHAANNTTYHVLPALIPAVGDTGNLGMIVQWVVVVVVVLIAGPKHLSRRGPVLPVP